MLTRPCPLGLRAILAISLILALALGLARNTQPAVPDISDICQELAATDDGDTDESGDGEVFILPLTSALAVSPLSRPSGEPPRALFASVIQPPAKPPPINA
ncbi:MAG: hypothetical protein ACKN9T_13015 [Candidatus Methylumidiphilus sp.]